MKNIITDRIGQGLLLTIIVGGAIVLIAGGLILSGGMKTVENAKVAPVTGACVPGNDVNDIDCAIWNSKKAAEAPIVGPDEDLKDALTDFPANTAIETPLTSAGCFIGEDEAACNLRLLKPQYDSSKDVLSWLDLPIIKRPFEFASFIATQIKLGAETAYNKISNFFVSPPVRTMIEVDSLPSEKTCTPETSCISFCEFGGDLQNCRTTNADCSVTLSTKGTACLPKPAQTTNGGGAVKLVPTSLVNTCLSSADFQSALSAFGKTLTAYEVAFSAYEKVEAAYVPNSGQSYPTYTNEYKNAMSKYSDSLTAYDALIFASDKDMLKCPATDTARMKLCISDYEETECVLLPVTKNSKCYIQESRIAINNCFR